MKLIKSYSFWVSLSGAVGILAVAISKIFGFEITADGVSEAIMALCGVLVVFGVVSKPKTTEVENKEENLENNDKKIEK